MHGVCVVQARNGRSTKMMREMVTEALSMSLDTFLVSGLDAASILSTIGEAVGDGATHGRTAPGAPGHTLRVTDAHVAVKHMRRVHLQGQSQQDGTLGGRLIDAHAGPTL